MVGSRVFLGGLNYRVSEWDIENFFKSFSGVGDITLKNGYAFVEFEERRDADDAVYEMNGKELLGGRVTVEKANERPRDGGSRYPRGRRGGGGGNYRGRRSRSPRRNPRDEHKFRLRVTNLSRSVTWRDLKDFMRQAGEVSYADVNRHGRNEGVVDFNTLSDMKNALRKFNGRDLRGRALRLSDENGHLKRRHSRSRSRSRSSSRSNSRQRSLSPTAKKTKYRERSISGSRSPSRDRSRSVSRDDRKLSKSPSRSPTPRRYSDDD